MYQLYHYPICPLSRQARILLHELGVQFSLVKENYWQRREGFLSLNHAGTLPVLINEELVISGIYPVLEYLNEQYPYLSFSQCDIALKSEVRRLLDWFNNKFYREVTKVIIDEKIIKCLVLPKTIRVDFIRIAKNNLTGHLNYIARLLENRSFLGGGAISYADIVASAHISTLDYLGEINWDLHPIVKEWYSILKSRPSFRGILQDIVPGFRPSANYPDLDF
jgi:glutathione S-transferase